MVADFSNAEYAIMQRVLELASRGNATTQPNPMVACVLVNNDEVVGEGFHHMAGELHAEREALKQAGSAARGATAYVNLEPCCHQGRTPPCTDGLIDAGITKVVAAMRDPNPLVAGGGFEMLKHAGIEVASGLLEEHARWLNRGFISRMQRKRPWVTLKTAATLDGRTAAFDGSSQWITGAEARGQVQTLRANSSAVVTGIGTVLADDPQMNVRLEGVLRQPLRVLLDSNLRLPLDAKFIADGEGVLIFTCSEDQEKISALTELGVEVVQQTSNKNNQLDLNSVLQELTSWQCNEVLVEAGQELCGSFLNHALVDELVLFYGGSLLGEQGLAMFQMGDAVQFEQRPEFKIRSAEMLDQDAKITAVSSASMKELLG